VVAILLVLLIIFIAQNTQKVQVAFLGWEGQTPAGGRAPRVRGDRARWSPRSPARCASSSSAGA
jgi:hypothetical protein